MFRLTKDPPHQFLVAAVIERLLLQYHFHVPISKLTQSDPQVMVFSSSLIQRELQEVASYFPLQAPLFSLVRM